MDATRVRALFPDAEIDEEGLCTKDKWILMIRGTQWGYHINALSLSYEKFEALAYWHQHPEEFATQTNA